ncbi:type IV secretory system conjugative DNA transfer family protein [Rhizobium paknamense]|uniref:Type IV secretion system protein VirD4 n=1 Tax=Rhizobium paknamense TaxID=1206817 RepID=A0ABU0IJ62_9HYPH|nr:type IV secretory system conjugative DNA transfer family protein [Rhizobium paknamense]MDQ0458295.1 hypothetical protein [Rhizobium paknamense]
MSGDLTPTARLNMRLAAMAASDREADLVQQARRDEATENAAVRLIAVADQTFADPVGIIRARWSRQASGSFIFSRAVHDFSDYEAFIYKLTLILAGLGAIRRDLAEALAASAAYAGGKARIERDAPSLSGYAFPEDQKLIEKGDSNEVPRPLAELAPDISAMVQHARSSRSSTLKAWIVKHAGAAPGAAIPASSKLFTDQPGPYTLPLGLSPDGRTLHYQGESSLLTIARQGSGKTQCHILPTLASYRGPAIVLDIKGECYAQTAQWRNHKVGPVLRFSPTEPDLSSRYNPLDFVSEDAEELWESSRFMADLLMVIDSRGDPSWERHGKDLLTLIIAFVTEVHDREDRTMDKVLDFVSTIGLEEMMAAVGAADSPFPQAMRRVAARFSQMASRAPKQFEGVLGAVSQHLQVWEGPKLAKVTAASDWTPEVFRTERDTMRCPTLYLCVPMDALVSYAPVLRVIIGQHVRRLMRDHSRDHAPILFLLDELPKLGTMDPIREALEVGRSYGIRLWMIAQYPEQLLKAYPDVGEGMMESCDVRMYMNPTSHTAERLSKDFGMSESVFGKSRKPRLEATTILSPTHRNSIFVLATNEAPQILRKEFFHEKGFLEP